MKIAYIGGWGHNYTAALVKDGKATAAVASDGCDAEAASKLAGRLNAPYFDSPLKLFAEFKPDIVSVGAVYGHIGRNIIVALEHGFPVTAEKPIASSFEDLERIRELTRKTGLAVVTEFDLRSNRAVVAAQHAVKTGVIGEVILATAQKSYRWGALPGQPPTRPAWYANRADYPGTIMWVASHGIDGVAFITGQKFTRVFTTQGNLSQPALLPMEDHTASTFTLANGGTAMVHADLCRPAAAASHGDDRFRVVGTLGQLEVRDGRCKLTRFDQPETDITESVSPAPTHERLVAALSGDAGMPYNTAASLETACVLLYARQSGDEKRVIDIPQ
jgi:predicted dehydrogenase